MNVHVFVANWLVFGFQVLLGTEENVFFVTIPTMAILSHGVFIVLAY